MGLFLSVLWQPVHQARCPKKMQSCPSDLYCSFLSALLGLISNPDARRQHLAVCLQGPPEGSPVEGDYAEELTQNVRPGETPDGPQDVPPEVPSASKGAY